MNIHEGVGDEECGKRGQGSALCVEHACCLQTETKYCAHNEAEEEVGLWLSLIFLCSLVKVRLAAEEQLTLVSIFSNVVKNKSQRVPYVLFQVEISLSRVSIREQEFISAILTTLGTSGSTKERKTAKKEKLSNKLIICIF